MKVTSTGFANYDSPMSSKSPNILARKIILPMSRSQIIREEDKKLTKNKAESANDTS